MVDSCALGAYPCALMQAHATTQEILARSTPSGRPVGLLLHIAGLSGLLLLILAR